MDVIIVCHTEFGFTHNKRIIFDKSAFGGVSVGVPNLLNLADKYGAKLTFAVMPEVVDYFPRNIEHEIGLHIHPGWMQFKQNEFCWYVGDMHLRKHCRQSGNSTVLSNYSYKEQLEMILVGKELLIASLGVEPKSFVAGRWGINNDTVRALIEAGITHECSACGKKSDHYDWSRIPRICMPYRPSGEDYQEKGDLPLMIVPISRTLGAGIVSPETAPVIGVKWLKACFEEYYRQNLPLFHICLHSPCMTDSYFVGVMDELLSFISGHEGVNFRFASEIAQYINSSLPRPRVAPYLGSVNWNLIKTFMMQKVLREKR